MVGIVAGSVMLLILFFLTEPLAYVPNVVLAAVVIVSAVGLFDFAALRDFYGMNRIELTFSVGTTLCALILGVLPAVLLGVILTLLLLLAITSRPADAVLGRVSGMKGFHDINLYPEAKTIPGLLLYRFEADIVFYNADYFKSRVLEAIRAAETPVEWVVIDASPVNVVDSTAVQKFDQLRDVLSARGIEMMVANRRPNVGRFFVASWVSARWENVEKRSFPTLKSAIRAFKKHKARLAAEASAGTPADAV
jgi:MFS superfamily sulfate permease-like transporter